MSDNITNTPIPDIVLPDGGPGVPSAESYNDHSQAAPTPTEAALSAYATTVSQLIDRLYIWKGIENPLNQGRRQSRDVVSSTASTTWQAMLDSCQRLDELVEVVRDMAGIGRDSTITHSAEKLTDPTAPGAARDLPTWYPSAFSDQWREKARERFKNDRRVRHSVAGMTEDEYLGRILDRSRTE